MLGIGQDPLLDPDGWTRKYSDNGRFVNKDCPLYVKKEILHMEEMCRKVGSKGFMLDDLSELKALIAKEEAKEKTK